MSEQPGLMNVAETPLPPLEAARKKLAAIEDVPPCYLKFEVERVSASEVYIRLAQGTKAKDVPFRVIEQAAKGLSDDDWGWRHEYEGHSGKPAEASEAEGHKITDATGIAELRKEVARLEAEKLKGLL